MVTVDPYKRICFCDIFHTTRDDMADGIYTSRTTAVNGHQKNWASLCRDVALYLLLISCR